MHRYTLAIGDTPIAGERHADFDAAVARARELAATAGANITLRCLGEAVASVTPGGMIEGNQYRIQLGDRLLAGFWNASRVEDEARSHVHAGMPVTICDATGVPLARVRSS